MSMIRIDKLRHSYVPTPASDDDYALKRVDLQWDDGGAYALLGQHDQAIATLKQWRNIVTGGSINTIYGSMVLPMLGLKEDAHELYQDALEASEGQYIPPGLLGVLAATIGERNAAFEHFDQALEERSLIASWLRDPLLDDIRDDPRFMQIFERMGLTPYGRLSNQ